ncbi:MAG: hypothetical protein EHM39_02845 [Chloroflexi bacterium]|nr:MAG: hypothetical protein EHM39_02845 [Chloroflexota bacterium]
MITISVVPKPPSSSSSPFVSSAGAGVVASGVASVVASIVASAVASVVASAVASVVASAVASAVGSPAGVSVSWNTTPGSGPSALARSDTSCTARTSSPIIQIDTTILLFNIPNLLVDR